MIVQVAQFPVTKISMTVLMGNPISAYLIALTLFTVGILLTLILKRVALGRIKKWAKRSKTILDDQLIRRAEKPITYLMYLGSFYISIVHLSLPLILQDAIRTLGIILTTLFIVRLTVAFLEYGIRFYWMARHGSETLAKSLNALIPAMKIVVWTLGLIFLLDNLGFDISAVIASLGIGGIAVALAAQGILADLFSYFSILLDRPFEIGDFVIAGDLMGTIENIGIKTTRLRSLGGEEWVVSNTDLTGARLQNFKRMEQRRIVFSFGVTYETEQEQMKAIPMIIQSIIEKIDGVTFDRAHFQSFGDFSLNYEVVYFVKSNDYSIFMDAQHQINLAIKHIFEQRQIQFAYPTQLLYVSNDTDEVPPTKRG